MLEQLLAQGIREQVFPGAAAAIAWGTGSARRTNVAWAGLMDTRDQSLVRENTLFDLASLSKALSTTLLFYSFFTEGRLRPEDRLGRFLPDIPADKQEITLRNLLSHASGLADYLPLYEQFAPVQRPENKAQLLRLILNAPLAYPSGTRCLYSDLGFILLGQVLEKVTGKDLAHLFQERISAPLGLANELFYQVPSEEEARCAATEDCPWRGRVIRGEVHDEHCWLMNGVAGHAGLFSTLTGVMSLCTAILDAWKKGQSDLPWAAFLPQGLQQQVAGQTWCLGFDTPSPRASSSGRYFSPQSVGHLGFTGTSFWLDPEQELLVVLLTHRVHPSRANKKIRQFRPWFHDAIMELLQRSS